MLATTTREILDSFTAEIAVLDGNGIIIAVNEAWTRFGANNGVRGGRAGVGADYLEVCENAIASDSTGTAQATLDGLRALMRGETDAFTLEYPCDSPKEERWYCLRASRFAGAETAFVLTHEDITARRRSENALRETERTLREVLETLPVGVWIMDRTGRITHGNPASLRIWSGARYVGPEQFGEYKGWWVSTGKPIAAEEWAAARAMKGEVSIDEEIEIECFDGTRKIILNSAMPLRDESGAISGAIIVNQDITARKAIEKELEQTLGRERLLARTDDLTGAFNRRHFFELAVREIAVAKRYRQPVSVILFDLDHFKRINDTGGHEAGDEALRSVARIVQDHLRESDLFARYGGEEFVLLLPRTTAEQAAIVAERIRVEIETDTALTISGGVAGLSFGDDSLDRLIRRADNALYRAKQEGRNRTVRE